MKRPSTLSRRAGERILSSARRLPRLRVGLVFLVFGAVTSVARAADEPSFAVLHLASGGVVPGELMSSDVPRTFRFQSPLFQQPFDFSLDGVSAINYRVPAMPPSPQGEYCLELVAGDVVFGDLQSLDAEAAELDTAQAGRVRLRREHIQRLYRWKGGPDLIYVGPNGLVGWKESSPQQFREEGGHLVTDKPGASIRGNFDIPAQAVVEFEVSWKTKPDFVFALGVDDNDDELVYKRAYRFEIWDEELVVRCELGREADVASVEAITSGAGRAHYVAYLDQIRGRMLVYSPNGTEYAQINIAPRRPQIHSGLRLTNKRGDVRLERLRVARWDGVPPGETQTDKPRLERNDGSITYGEVTAFDAAKQQFTFRDDQGVSAFAADQLVSVHMVAKAETAPRELRAAYQDGSRYSGQLVKIADGKLHLNHHSCQAPLALPLKALRSLVVLQRDDSTPPVQPGIDRRTGRLELKGQVPGGPDEPLWFKEGLPETRLAGWLVNGDERPGASCLVWQPDFSATASPLKPGVAGRIVYRDPPPRANTAVQSPRTTERQLGFAGAFVESLSKQRTVPVAPAVQRTLHLRSGDTMPCDVVRIDETGITFRTGVSDATFVSHDKVKAIDLVAGASAPRLDKIKRDRLLTLPRLQKESPPTHLVRSRNGDFLRGRIVAMDDKSLHIEVRLETKQIPRDRIAQIIWLHADELLGEPPATPESSPEQPPGTRVQALRSDGIRLTFSAEKFANLMLAGTSDVLGSCRVDLRQVDQLLIGNTIEQAAAELAYNQWKLHYAIEPKIAQDLPGGGEGGTSGIESDLVGKPAPDFELPLLGGEKFHLANARGQVVILDFWATWCGPCMQSMPLVEEVAHEFQDQGVKLIAVNLEEPPNQIQGTLERHRLNPTVALDRDGVVAAKYQVSAIPQTVIVDRDGKIARLYIGGGPKLAEQLREALHGLLMSASEKSSE